MLNRKRWLILFGGMLTFFFSRAQEEVRIDFIDEKFDAFLERIVAKNDRALFSNYYGKISALLNAGGDEDINYEGFFKKALANLKRDHSDWFDIVDRCIKERPKKKDDPLLQKVQTFLTRYGVYCDFLDIRKQALAERNLPNFVDGKFEDFINRVVAQDDRDLFALYYARLSEETTRGDSSKIRATHSYFFSKALEDMKKNKPEWFKEISQFLSGAKITGDTQVDSKIEKAQLFLRRYGAYQEFCEIKDFDRKHEDKIAEKRGVLAQIGTLFSNIGKTVAGWFGFGVAKSA